MLNLFNRKTITSQDEAFELAGGVKSDDWLKATAYRRPFYARFSLRFQF